MEIRDQIKDIDIEKLYIITKHIAENDSVGEGHSRCKEFSREHFDDLIVKNFSEMNAFDFTSDYILCGIELYNKLF